MLPITWELVLPPTVIQLVLTVLPTVMKFWPISVVGNTQQAMLQGVAVSNAELVEIYWELADANSKAIVYLLTADNGSLELGVSRAVAYRVG